MNEQRRLYTLWHITSTATEVRRKPDAPGAPGRKARLCGEDAFRELENKNPLRLQRTGLVRRNFKKDVTRSFSWT